MYQVSFSKITKWLVSALMVASVVFFVGCSKDDDKGGNNGNNGNNNSNNNNKTGNVVIDAALHGTWVGDGTYGTLIIDAKGFTSQDASSAAKTIAGNLADYNSDKCSLKASGGEIIGNFYGTESKLYTYTIEGSTLTLKSGQNGNVQFVGKK